MDLNKLKDAMGDIVIPLLDTPEGTVPTSVEVQDIPLKINRNIPSKTHITKEMAKPSDPTTLNKVSLLVSSGNIKELKRHGK